MARLMSFPLLKYSYANSPPGETANFSWTHTVDHLIVVFDSFRGSHSSLLMKVTQGAALLEQVDLQGKVNEALEVVAAMRASGSEIRLEHLPISALVRCPLLALRYTRPDGMVRRIQMKFAADSEFQQAYDLLSQIGCHMSSSVVASRPSTAISTSVPGSSSSIGRPATALPAPTSSSSTTTLGRSSSPTFFRFAGTHGASNLQQLSMPQSSHQQNSELSHRESAPLALDDSNVQPPPAQPLHVMDSQHNRGPSQPEYLQSQSRLQRTATLSARDSRDGYTQNDISEYVRNGGTASGFFDQSSSNLQSQSTHSGSCRPGSGPTALLNRMSTQLGTIAELEEARPTTAPVSQHEVSQHEPSLTSLLPPRRELPFRREKSAQASRGSNDSSSSSRPSSARPSSARPTSARPSSSSNMDPPPLPASVLRLKKGKQREENDTNRSRSVRDPPPSAIPKLVNQKATQEKSQKGLSASGPSRSRDTGFSSAYFAPPEPQQVTPSPPKRPLSAIAEAEINTRQGHPITPQSSNHNPTNSENVQSAETLLPDDLNRALSRVTDLIGEAGTQNLSTYVALPYETRRQMLDSFIVESLGDNDFITLCEDMGACWRRIALGLRGGPEEREKTR